MQLAEAEARAAAKAAEVEQVRAAQAQAAQREAQLAALAKDAGTDELKQTEYKLLTELASAFPECATDFGVQRLSQENPQRYQDYVRSRQAAEIMWAASKYQVYERNVALQQQRAQASAVYAQQAVNQVFAAHPEYQGPTGQANLTRDIQACVEARRARGQTDAQISADLNDPANYNPQNIEAFLALRQTAPCQTRASQWQTQSSAEGHASRRCL